MINFFKRINVMVHTYRKRKSCEMEVEVTLRKKNKLLAVCGMMTFDPKYSYESPFANILGE